MLKFKPEFLNVYFICGSQDLVPGDTLDRVVDQALKAGITAYQFRDKGPNSQFSANERLQAARRLRRLCAKYQVPFIVDDDLQLALAVQADGIHVGQSDEKIEQVISEVGQEMFIGLSCSNETELQAAEQVAGIDYYGCGPVYKTGSKADAAPVIALNGLHQLVELASRPVVGIGGITTKNARKVRQTGAKGSAVISEIAQSPDIFQTVQQLKTKCNC